MLSRASGRPAGRALFREEDFGEDGAVFEDVPQGVLFEGKEAIAASYQERFDAFPDMVRTIDRMTTGDQGTVTEITMRGVQKGVYLGLPPPAFSFA